MKSRHAVLLIATLFVSMETRAEDCSEDCKLTEVKAYFESLDAVFRKGSTHEDIDNLFSLFDENVKYEHIEYGAEFDREAWESAFTRNLENGAYGNGPEDQIRVLTTIPGGSHMAVEYAYGAVDENGNWNQTGDGLLVLFGFNGDRIVLVREYWE